MKYTPFPVKNTCRQVQLMANIRQVVVSMIIMYQSGQSFSSDKKGIIIQLIAQRGFFQLSKEIASIREYFVVYFCFKELLIIFVRSLLEKLLNLINICLISLLIAYACKEFLDAI